MPPSVLAGRYELRTRIGSGGMAAVWGAYDRRLGRDVAVKILSESLADDERYRTRLEREARHIASLAHPNIVVVHDVGVEDNQPFIVMELVKGKSLRQLLSESSPLQPEKVAALASDVLAGLGHAHEAGILHRDIKPGNILVTDSGVSKLADFGIAKATEETVDLTDSGAILGTVSYASPEQLSGNVLGPPSDLYSLGGVLYECLAGHPPFVADNIAALVSQQQFARPEPLQSVSSGSPDELRMAIMRALEKDPARRFASAAEMKRGLGSAVGYGSEGRHPVSIRGALPRARTATVTVLFCDVVGSTALQSDIGDDAADGIRRRLFDVLRSVVETHNGNMVKTMGDGVMAVFTESTVDALRCAIEMTRMAPTVTDGLAVRVGLSHGEVTSEGGDWFGTPVVEAARLESASEPGTVLAAEVVRTIVGSRGGFIFDELPPIALKGFQNPVRAVRVCNAKAVSLPEKLSGLTARFPRETLKPHTLRSRRLIACGTAITLVVLAAVLVPVLVNGTPAGHLSSASLIGTEAGYTPRYVSVRCPSSTGGTRVTCGQLIVPQDRSHPKGLQVHLLVVRAGALTSQPASDPVVDLGDVSLGAEGPSSETRLYSTYISLSRRGGYGSIPELNCPEEETAQEASLALPLGSAVALSEQENAFTTCRTRLIGAHVDPNAYGNDAAAADYRDLLRVLHIERANLLVGSNGSLLAFALMRQYPELVRSVTIEDPVAPGFNADVTGITNLAGAFNRYIALCNADQRCHASFPDLLAQAIRSYSRLQQNPVTVDVPVQSGKPPLPVLVNGDSGDIGVQTGLSVANELGAIASQIYAPDPMLLGTAIETSALSYPDVVPVVWGAWASNLCKDQLPGVPDFRRLQEQVDKATYPQYAGLDALYQADLLTCKAWNVQPDAQSNFTPIVSAIPTFLFGGALDPLSAPSWYGQIAQGLTHANVVVFPTLTGHMVETSSAPTCLTALRLAFLRDPTGHLNIAGCEAQSPPINFAGS